MAAPEVQTLLDAVRRRLWRGSFAAATRSALWGSAAVSLLAVALHLATLQISMEVVLAAVAGLWASMFAWAARRWPADAACALWADRHLGGACAYTTLLELSQGGSRQANPAALRRLEDWAAAKASQSLRLLIARHDPARLSRPAMAMIVCAALATLVVNLGHNTPAIKTQAAARDPLNPGERGAPAGEPSATGALASEIAKAVRAADVPRAAEHRGADATQQARRAPSVGAETAAQAPAAAQPAAAVAGFASAASAMSGSSVPPGREAPTAGVGATSGREAGDRRDDRADMGVSRAPQGRIAAQGAASSVQRMSGATRADMQQPATYDEDLRMPTTTAMGSNPPIPAATSPTATSSTLLTPSQTTYVQAWMKASARHK